MRIPLTRLAIIELSRTRGKGLLEAAIEIHPYMHRLAGLVYFFVFNFVFCVQVDCMVRRLLGGLLGMDGFPGKYVNLKFLKIGNFHRALQGPLGHSVPTSFSIVRPWNQKRETTACGASSSTARTDRLDGSEHWSSPRTDGLPPCKHCS